jgi:hypothetical protein
MNGLDLFSRFAFMPNKLGYCGEQSFHNKALKFLEGDFPEEKLREEVKYFSTAFPYLSLIAEKNSLDDFLDERVVEAYFLGNSLLEQCSAEGIKKLILRNFVGEEFFPKEVAQKFAERVPQEAKPFHSFHAIFIFSFSSALPKILQNMDSCRISWGKILGLEKENNSAIVEYNPLAEVNGKILFGSPCTKRVSFLKQFTPNLQVGEMVAFHWNLIALSLSPKQLANLKHFSEQTLNVINLVH